MENIDVLSGGGPSDFFFKKYLFFIFKISCIIKSDGDFYVNHFYVYRCSKLGLMVFYFQRIAVGADYYQSW